MTPMTAQQYREAVERQRSYVIDLPWPDRRLHPNARVHWAVKAKATKAARRDAYWEARGCGVPPGMDAEMLKVRIVFHPPDRRKRDLDNLLSNSKALLDGIADAAGIDDSRWHISMRKGDPRPNGCVRIFLEAVE